MVFKLSDESINDYGYRILTKGIDLKRFKQNPVMLWMHKRDSNWNENAVLPIGKWEKIKINGVDLTAQPVFDETDELALKIKSKVEQDIIKMTSVGIRVIEVSDDPKLMLKGQTRPTITKCELIEVSMVDIGANKNAVKLYSDGGEELSIDDVETLSLVTTKKPNKMKIELSNIPFIGKLFSKPEGDEVKEIEVNEENLQTVEKEIEKLNSELEEKNAKIEELESKVEELESKVEELTTEDDVDPVEELKSTVESLQSELAEIKSGKTEILRTEDPNLEDEENLTENEKKAQETLRSLGYDPKTGESLK